MFNSTYFDVAIGLVFIFFIYSLLVTSLHEAIATTFGFRARMLRDAIATGMLTDTPSDSRWQSFVKGVKFFLGALFRVRLGTPADGKLGEKFFLHPLIRNYGASRFYPLPSYIPTQNFEGVMIDLLHTEYETRKEEIKAYRLAESHQTMQAADFDVLTDIAKINEVIAYYARFYASPNTIPPNSIIDRDTWQILQMHLRSSLYDIEKFKEKLGGWFDDTMNRVSGWYKRQTQFILILLGFLVAVFFNVDVIEIGKRLSTNPETREKLVLMAGDAVEHFQNDARVKKMINAQGQVVADSTVSHTDFLFVYNDLKSKADSVQKLAQGDISKVNEILALGWEEGDWKKAGLSRWSFMLREAFTRRFPGFLLLALAVSLGSPFWFDLLNKMVKIRNSGKKEESKVQESSTENAKMTVNVQLKQTTDGEAVG